MDTSMLRLAGIAAAALAAPTAFFIYGLVGWEPAEFSWSAVFVAAFIAYGYGLMVSVPVSLAFGLPYVLWLQARGRLSWLNVCAGAAVAGGGVFTALWALSFQFYKPLWVFALLGLGSGLLSGAAFCVVMRPNKSFKPIPLRGTA